MHYYIHIVNTFNTFLLYVKFNTALLKKYKNVRQNVLQFVLQCDII